MTLYIDTADFNRVTFVALQNKKIRRRIYKIDPHESHRTLAKLEEFLKTNKIQPGDIKKIVVNKGPGSFTGVRIGIVMAQALGLAWNVPVKALGKEKFGITLSGGKQKL